MRASVAPGHRCRMPLLQPTGCLIGSRKPVFAVASNTGFGLPIKRSWLNTHHRVRAAGAGGHPWRHPARMPPPRRGVCRRFAVERGMPGYRQEFGPGCPDFSRRVGGRPGIAVGGGVVVYGVRPRNATPAGRRAGCMSPGGEPAGVGAGCVSPSPAVPHFPGTTPHVRARAFLSPDSGVRAGGCPPRGEGALR